MILQNFCGEILSCDYVQQLISNRAEKLTSVFNFNKSDLNQRKYFSEKTSMTKYMIIHIANIVFSIITRKVTSSCIGDACFMLHKNSK